MTLTFPKSIQELNTLTTNLAAAKTIQWISPNMSVCKNQRAAEAGLHLCGKQIMQNGNQSNDFTPFIKELKNEFQLWPQN